MFLFIREIEFAINIVSCINIMVLMKNMLFIKVVYWVFTGKNDTKYGIFSPEGKRRNSVKEKLT